MDFNESPGLSPEVVIATQQRIILELREVIRQQESIIVRLQNEVSALKERLNKNSSNSSMPPSSDGLTRPKPHSLREKSGRKPGAQRGHKGHGFLLPDHPTEDVIHKPVQCAACHRQSLCESCGRSAVRNVVDVEISVKIMRHYTEKYICPLLDGKIISGTFPEGINSSVQYGDRIRALAVALNTAGMMGIDRVHQILSGVFGLPVSTGTVARMTSQFASRITDAVEGIKKALSGKPVVNCDETSTRVGKEIYWAHSACDAKHTYLSLQRERGSEGMKKAGFMPIYTGTIIHDCLSAYWTFAGLKHGLCGAHLLRELQGVIDNDPKATWAKSMQNLLVEMSRQRRQVLASGATRMSEDLISRQRHRYMTILGKALSKYPVDPCVKGRPKRSKARALIDRLRGRRDEVLRFLSDPLVPFTNNLAEQSVRMWKVKTKVSGCFRTFRGGSAFAAIMSYLHTAMKRGIPAFTAICKALEGNSYSAIFGIPPTMTE